jgi:hypothetical protein
MPEEFKPMLFDETGRQYPFPEPDKLDHVNYTRDEWRSKLHSKLVKMKTTLETSEVENYTRNEWKWIYTRNECILVELCTQ